MLSDASHEFHCTIRRNGDKIADLEIIHLEHGCLFDAYVSLMITNYLIMKLKTSIDQWPPLQARDFLLFSLNHPALLFGSRGTDVDLLSSGFALTLLDLVANDSVETVLSTFCLSFDFNVLRLIVPATIFVTISN